MMRLERVGGWLPNVPAVVEAWYPGMEGGNAVADVLFGNINPSGRILFTWPKKLEDSPSHKLGHEDKDYVYYDEKLMVGYRYYDTKNIEPEFPFGYGLSYTSFKYEKMKLSKGHDNSVKVSVSLKNEGSHDGYETVQVYVKPINPSIDRPIHELKAFKKVFMKANQTLSVDFELKADAFSFYNIDRKEWQVDKCKYEIEVGASSRNIFLRKSVTL